jgi:integrase
MRQRGKGAWELRVYRGIDPETGRQRWLTKTVHGSRRHAQTQLATLVEEASHARIRAGTVGDLLERWFSAASAHWAPSTVRQTRSVVTHHLLPHLGHMAVTKLTTADIDDLYAHLLRVGGRNARRLSPGTVHRVHVVLHRALAQAVRWEWIWTNPASTATPPRLEPAEIRPPSADSVAALLESVRGTDPALFTYLRLAVCTGARRSQLLALRWDEVDLARGAIAFTRALVQGPDGPELRPTKNRRSYRVALDADTLAVVDEHWRRVLQLANTADIEAPGERFVFSRGSDGVDPWRPNLVTKRFIRARRAAGLPQFRLHDLRHFMATQMLAAGVPIATVSQRLSHARASTTLNVYAHAVPGGDEEAAETLARILASGRRSVMPESRRRAIG